jgi:HSP20 family protein
MPGLILWKNQHINRLKKDIDTMFDRVWGEYGLASSKRIIRRAPSFEVTETRDNFILIAKVPDVDPHDMEISITGDLLTIRGKIPQEIIKESGTFYRAERVLDAFSRTIKIPCRIQVDAVEAVYEKGILKIVMPKGPPDKTRIIRLTEITR